MPRLSKLKRCCKKLPRIANSGIVKYVSFNRLNIETKQTIAVASNIYNTLGQIVLVIPNTQQTKTVDVSSLKTGNYLMKINSDKGCSSVKFLRM
jgi:hypothetical protein